MSKHTQTVQILLFKFKKEYLGTLANGKNSFADISRILNLDYKMTRRLYSYAKIDYTYRDRFGSRKGMKSGSKYLTLQQANNAGCIKSYIYKKFLTEQRGHQCEHCKNTMWNNQKIYLQLHHKDGNKFNNIEDNLELLCLNCHQQTDNFGFKGRTIKS